MEDSRIIGHVVAVNGFRVKVEILKEARSPSRATLDGVKTAVAINSYLSFSIGAGISIIGIVTDLEARESYDPSSGDELSLELLKARRVITVQLLGTVKQTGSTQKEKGNNWVFDPGITVLPTLDTPVEVISPKIMDAVFETPPKKNKPENYSENNNEYDYGLVLGSPTGQKNDKVKASYNDLFSRPLAIVGNTGSGKSYSVASILQKAMRNDNILGNCKKNAPHVFILDINGEYAPACLLDSNAKETRLPDHIYLNGEEFGIPIWFLNSQEICTWLSTSEQTQEPVLKDWWSIIKSTGASNSNTPDSLNLLQNALESIDSLLEKLSGLPQKSACSYRDAIIGYLQHIKTIDTDDFYEEFRKFEQINKYNTEVVPNQYDIRREAECLIEKIKTEISNTSDSSNNNASTSDSPLLVKRKYLFDPRLINRAASQSDKRQIDGHLTTLKLRLKTRLDDKRWVSFLNYEKKNTEFSSLADWFEKFGFQNDNSERISVIDLSMLSHEVLPYACAVIGRILLDTRERLPANKRYENPWVLVLEEAHNYARPAKASEDRGQKLSRTAFERVAKEGRKFGLSLIVASQRPSEISPTIISQCANFISHRLQNPDDIDHFKKIIPMQARRLLEQVTVLTSGEAIVFGSAFHIPARVQIDIPSPEPWSQTAAPYHEWKKDNTTFPLDEVMQNWGLDSSTKENSNTNED